MRGRAELKRFFVELRKSAGRARDLRAATLALLAPLCGRALLDASREGCRSLARAFEAIHPRSRLPWVGPGMSARSSISAAADGELDSRAGRVRSARHRAP